MSPKLKSKLVFILKLCVSVGLLSYLIFLIDWDQVLVIMKLSNKWILGSVLFITLGSFVYSALRWRLILADNHINYSFWKAYKGYLIGLFYSIFLPGVLGGDPIRIGICVQNTKCSITTSTAAVLLERVGGFVSVLFIFFTMTVVSPMSVSTLLTVSNTQWLSVFGILGIIIGFVIIATRRIWVRWIPQKSKNKLVTIILRFLHTFANTLSTLSNRTLWLVLVLSILFQVLDIAATFLLSRAIGMQVPIYAYFVIIPLTYLVLVLPVSLGGLGLREGTLVFLLSRFGAHETTAVLLSFLIYLNRMLVGCIGGFVQLLGTIKGNRLSVISK